MATRLTDYKKGAMRAEKLAHAPKRSTHADPGGGSKDLPAIPPVTLRAAKAAHALPASVIAQTIKITRRRYALYNPRVNMRRLKGKKLKAALEKFLISRKPDPDLIDDWVLIDDDYWFQDRHPYR